MATKKPFIMDNTNVDKTGTILFPFKMFSPIFAAKKHNNRLLKELMPNPLTKYISWSIPLITPIKTASFFPHTIE